MTQFHGSQCFLMGLLSVREDITKRLDFMTLKRSLKASSWLFSFAKSTGFSPSLSLVLMSTPRFTRHDSVST